MKKTLKQALSLFLVMIMLCSLGLPVFAAESTELQNNPIQRIYVKANDGDDDNAGDEANPLLTLGAALQKAADGTEIVLLSDIPVTKELVISGQNISIQGNGHAIQFVGTANIGTKSGILKIVNNATVELQNITVEGSAGQIDGRAVYAENSTVTLRNAVLRKGRVETVSPTTCGAGLYVGSGANVQVEAGAAFIENVSTGNGGAIYVAAGGELTMNGAISVRENRANNGAGIYVADTGSADLIGRIAFDGNIAGGNGGAMYVESDASASVSGEVQATDHQINQASNNIYLAQNATLDIAGATLNATLGITAADEYEYRLISNQVQHYTIKTEPRSEADENAWTDDCGEWVIRYLMKNNVPGLYLVHKALDVEFSNVNTLTSIEGIAPNGEKTNLKTADIPGAETENGVLSIPELVRQSNQQSVITEDVTFGISCDENYRIPEKDVISITCDGTSVDFDYEPDFETGTATITIRRNVVDALPQKTIVFALSAEKYYTLTVQANGPLYAMQSSITNIAQKPLVITHEENGTVATYNVTRDGDPVQNVIIELHGEGSSATLTAQTNEQGIALFEGLVESVAYYPILRNTERYKVIARDVITFDPISTLEGQTLADGVSLSAGTAEYLPASSKLTVKNLNQDATLVISVNQAKDAIVFMGNEGDASSAPARLTLGVQSADSSITKEMAASATTVGAMPTATLAGYTFAGWYDNADCAGAEIKSSTAYSTGRYPVLYAKWVANKNTHYSVQHWIEYAENGINEGKTGSVQDGYYLYDTTEYTNGESDAVVDISNLALETMDSAIVTWWTRNGFTASAQDADCKVLADGTAVFKIYYNRNVYDVTFKTPLTAGTAVNDAVIPAQTVKFGDVYGALPDPKLPGYNYDASQGVWYDGDRLVTATTVHQKTEDVELSAKWNANDDTKWAIRIALRTVARDDEGVVIEGSEYQIYKTVYRDNDGKLLIGSSDGAVTKNIADIASLAVPGYHMTGYSAEFDATGENKTANTTSFTVYVKPTNASTDLDGQYNADFDGAVVCLYYDRNTLPIIVIDGQDKEHKDNIIFGGDFTGHLPPDPGKDGYDFTGWVDGEGNAIDKDTSADDYVVKGETLIITPTWKARKYQLTYVPGKDATFVPAEGTTGEIKKSTTVAGGYINPSEVEYDQAFGTLPSANKTGHNFAGWQVRLNSDNVDITSESIVTIDNVVISNAPTYTYENTRPLYAKYEPHTYNLVFIPGKTNSCTPGTVSPTTMTVTYGEEISDLPVPQLPGYRFVEWRLKASSPETRLENGAVWNRVYTDKATVYVYAVWVPQSFKYTFDLNDAMGSTKGSLVDTSIDYVEETFDSVYNGVFTVEATRPGYDFLGWSLTPAGEVLTADDLNDIAADTTVYAIWQAKLYDVKLVLKGSRIVDLSDNTSLETYDPTAVYDATTDTWTIKVAFDSTYGVLPVPTKVDAKYHGYCVTAPGWPEPSIHETVLLELPQYIDYTDENGIILTVVMEPYFTFDPAGGQFVEDKSTEPKKELQSDITELPKVEKEGFIHDGWLDESGQKITIKDLQNKTEPETLRPNYITKVPSSGGGGVVSFQVTFESNGGSAVPAQTVNAGGKAKEPTAPTKEFYEFQGWYADSELTSRFDFTKTKIRQDITLYAKWEYKGTFTYLTEEHVAYIKGRGDGLVHPEAHITRAEVAMIFYRLLKDSVRKEYAPGANTSVFSDVGTDNWFYMAANTLNRLGIVKGRSEGIFAPDAEITRAELAAIAARFDVLEGKADAALIFPDVSDSHWAYQEIGSAAAKGWVTGRGDGTFAPDAYITRAEMITLINRVLNRDKISEFSIASANQMICWEDNMDKNAWYYLAIQEATNAHTFTISSGVEQWDKLLPTEMAD